MNDAPTANILNRTLSRLRGVWRQLARAGDTPPVDRVSPDLPSGDMKRLKEQIDACLEGRGGEVSARGRAAELGQTYLGLNERGRARFLHVLALDFGSNRNALEEAIEAVKSASGEAAYMNAEALLREALVAPRVKLMTQFNALPEGVKFLVELRSDLLQFSRDDPLLVPVEHDLKQLLDSWFDVGFLELRRITWEASAALLEKLIDYEAVHEIRSWEELKGRLDSDRRCYAFFHPSMPEEPLIFIEVALVNGMADNVQELLALRAEAEDPESADTAVFYSISNAQKGLVGINFGGFLIKRVVDDLARDLPGIKTYATLSPVPGFRTWLNERLAAAPEDLLTEAEDKAMTAATDGETGAPALKSLLAKPAWSSETEIAELLQAPLLRLCAHYLLEEKVAGRALDSVANFHLTNGARIERLNWNANLSPQGIQQSAGIMVNYLYKLDEIETNHEAYRGEGEVACVPAVRSLLKD